MAVKGAVAKVEIQNKILEMFEGAFVEGKELRIPMMENGEYVEIKVALTAAKTAIREPGAKPSPSVSESVDLPWNDEPVRPEPTQEEKDNLMKLIGSF